MAIKKSPKISGYSTILNKRRRENSHQNMERATKGRNFTSKDKELQETVKGKKQEKLVL
jgi:hypothetical protein